MQTAEGGTRTIDRSGAVKHADPDAIHSGGPAVRKRWWATAGFAVFAVIASGCGDEDSAPGAAARGTQLAGTKMAWAAPPTKCRAR